MSHFWWLAVLATSIALHRKRAVAMTFVETIVIIAPMIMNVELANAAEIVIALKVVRMEWPLSQALSVL